MRNEMKSAFGEDAKKILIPILVLSILTAGVIFWAGNVNAEISSPKDSLVDKLVEKFNLNKDDVQSVFTEIYKERQQQMLDRLSAKLDQAVKNGKITADQRQSLMNKETEIMNKYEELRKEWETWADESGIDFDQLREYGMGPCGMGFGGKFGGRHFGRGGWGGW